MLHWLLNIFWGKSGPWNYYWISIFKILQTLAMLSPVYGSTYYATRATNFILSLISSFVYDLFYVFQPIKTALNFLHRYELKWNGMISSQLSTHLYFNYSILIAVLLKLLKWNTTCVLWFCLIIDLLAVEFSVKRSMDGMKFGSYSQFLFYFIKYVPFNP